VQSQAQTHFPQRMYLYHTLIFQRYRKPVVSLAILADEQKNWRPQQYNTELWGCRVALEFPIAKLLDYQEQIPQLRESRNPFAVIVEAHLATQQTRNTPQTRYQQKLRLVKSLYRRGYGREDILELFRLIDWMLKLPESLEADFGEEIEQFEEENRMGYITSIERRGMQQGIRQGIQDLLEARFPQVSDALILAIQEIDDIAVLRSLLTQAGTINSLEEFEQSLPIQSE
jgi:hypothetical protein